MALPSDRDIVAAIELANDILTALRDAHEERGVVDGHVVCIAFGLALARTLGEGNTAEARTEFLDNMCRVANVPLNEILQEPDRLH